MGTVTANRRAKVKDFLLIRNLTAGHVSFMHPDTRQEVTVNPYWSVTLRNPDEWEDLPDLQRLVGKGLLAVSRTTRRAPPPLILPSPHSELTPVEKATAYQIAFYPPNPDARDNDMRDMAQQLIGVEPIRDTPDLSSESPNLDVPWLKTRFRLVLNAALWLLKNMPDMPEWKDERIASINHRLQLISAMRD